MFQFLYPDLFESSIHTIPYKKLLQKNIRYLIFDIDNTVVPHFVKEPDQKLIDFFRKLKAMGFSLCFVSNGRHQRVSHFVGNLDIPFIPQAQKPLRRGINKALQILSAQASQTAIIGDQIFTDIWCGRRCGLFSILVKPVSQRDEWFVALKRGIENIVMKEYLKDVKRSVTK